VTVDHYDASVNKGDLNMRSFTNELNQRWEDGWKLAYVFSHGGNTIVVWERTQA
jgi:hypothetical protein